jgi:hypothetical protein
MKTYLKDLEGKGSPTRLNTKPNKKTEQFIADKFRLGGWAPKDVVLFAYGEPGDSNFDYMPKQMYFVRCTKKGIRLYSFIEGNICEPADFSKKDNIDCVTQVLNYVQQHYSGKINLASWVTKYALEKYDANCPLQLDNLLQQGDHESLFAGKDACKRIEEIVKGGE